MRRSVEIKLTEADRSELERLARGRRVWRSLSDRAHIVLLAAEGLTNVQIANTLGINSHTARKWRKPVCGAAYGRARRRDPLRSSTVHR